MNLKGIFKSLGLYSNKNRVAEATNSGAEDYQLSEHLERINAHRNFLYRLDDQESKRMETIESKTSLIISQTAIVFSLLGLLIPFLVDKIDSLPIILKVLLLLVVFLAFLSYLLSLRNAIKNFKITNFKYQSPGIGNVISFKDKSEELFAAEEVRDLISSISVNKTINNQKGTNLLHAYNAFKLGNLFMGISITLLIVSLLFLKSDEKSIQLQNPIEIKGIEELNKSIKSIKVKPDTIIIRKEE